MVIVLRFLLGYARDDARLTSGKFEPYWILLASRQYAQDHGDVLPPLDPEPGRLMFDRTVMASKYQVTGATVISDLDPNVPFPKRAYRENPVLRANADLIDDYSWWYLGYTISNEREGRAFARAYVRRIVTGGNFEEELTDESSPPTAIKRLVRLPEPKDDGVLDAIPVFVERPGHYGRFKGGYVVYRDGHSEYIEYPGRFPMSKEFIETLETLDKIGKLFKKP